MNKILLLVISLFSCISMQAQSIDGATYALPKTGVAVTLLVERTVYTPGELAEYAQRYLRSNDVSQKAKTSYRIISAKMSLYAEPDTSKVHTAHIDPKHNIQSLALSPFGSLQAVNTTAPKLPEVVPFKAAPRKAPVNARKFLNEEVLSAGSKMKMAELIAKDIYEIRESRSELTRGQADYMPKDGEQLRLMLVSLDEQEQALREMMEGTTVVDTTETVLHYMPVKGKDVETVLFRFSPIFGLCDADDFSGEPYYIAVKDLHSLPQHIMEPGKKTPKDETGIWINLPGKAHVSILSPLKKTLWTIDGAFGQLGETENLNEPLFSKKVNTRLLLNPYNGGIESIESSQVMK